VSILCEHLDANIAEIVAEWQRLTHRPPWTSLTESQWVDHLPPLLRAMIEAAACSPGSHDARRRVVEFALVHGEHRRALELPFDILFDEHSCLRNATWRLLTDRSGPNLNDSVVAEIVRIDAAVSFATMASLRGYHKSEIETTQDWNEVIDRLVDDWENVSLTP
jgi:hypothetical protein